MSNLDAIETELVAARRVQSRSLKRTTEALAAAGAIASSAGEPLSPAARGAGVAGARTILTAVQEDNKLLHGRLSKLSKAIALLDEKIEGLCPATLFTG